MSLDHTEGFGSINVLLQASDKMKEELALVLLTLIFGAFSYQFHVPLIWAKGRRYVLLLLGYILCTFLFYIGSVTLHEYLRSKGIHFEIGHAEDNLLKFFFYGLF
jgi:hypothetical protein